MNALAPFAHQGAPSERRWFGLARFMLTHPVTVTICAVAVMVIAGLPFLRVELTQANAKSLLAVLGLGAKRGTTLRLSADGDDAAAAVDALSGCVVELSD